MVWDVTVLGSLAGILGTRWSGHVVPLLPAFDHLLEKLLSFQWPTIPMFCGSTRHLKYGMWEWKFYDG